MRPAFERIRANDPQRSEIGSLQHLFERHRSGIRRQTHIDGAAGIRIIDKTNVLYGDAKRIAELDQLADSIALYRVAKNDDEFRLFRQLFTQRKDFFEPAANTRDSVLVFAHRLFGHGVNMRLVMAEIGADLEGEEWML